LAGYAFTLSSDAPIVNVARNSFHPPRNSKYETRSTKWFDKLTTLSQAEGQIQNLHPVESSEGGPPTGGIPQGRFSNVQNVTTRKDLSGVSVIWILVIRICFGFRYSDFGFTLDMCLCGKQKDREHISTKYKD
jgi:hypothetical protein